MPSFGTDVPGKGLREVGGRLPPCEVGGLPPQRLPGPCKVEPGSFQKALVQEYALKHVGNLNMI